MRVNKGPPAGLFENPLVPAPAAVKGSACGPLRALDRFSRGHGLPTMTGGPTLPQNALSCLKRRSRKAEPRSPMTKPSPLEDFLVVRPAVATDGNDDPEPDIAEHPNRFRMLLPTLAGLIVVPMGPSTMSEARERKLPQRFSQGMDARATKVNGAGGPTRFRDRSGARLALGDVWIAIPVAIIAQFSYHPGGEDISSTGQTVVELAVRMEPQYPLNLPLVGIEVFDERLQLRNQRSCQPCLGPNDGRHDMKAGCLHPLMDRRRSLPAVRAAMAPQKGFQIGRAHV